MYDFIVDKDWLNRSGPFVFNLEHIVFLTIMMALGLVLPLLLRGRSQKTIKRVIMWLWIGTYAMDICKWCGSWYVWMVEGNLNMSRLGSILPLYTCSMFLYIMPIALFAKREKIKTAALNFMCTMMLPLGFVSMFLSLMMTVGCSLFSFYGLHTLIYHSMLYIVPMVILITGYYKPKWKDVWSGLLLFACIVAVVLTFDTICKVDYMYLYDGSTFTVVSFITNAVPHRLVWTAILLVCYFVIMVATQALILGIIKLVNKKKVVIEDKKEPQTE